MKEQTLGFIGGGRVVSIFLNAFARAGKNDVSITVYDPNEEVIKKLATAYPVIDGTNSTFEKAAACDIVFLAVHPPVMMELLSSIKNILRKNSIIVSLAPKVSIAKIREALGGHAPVARVNPNANGFVNKGLNPVSFSGDMKIEDRKTLLILLEILGAAPVVDDSKIEAYALVSAMGPTYFWFQLEHLKNLGVSFGLEEKEALHAVSHMITGAVAVMNNSELTSDEMMNLVPVKPLSEYAETINGFYSDKLMGIYEKIKSI